MRWLVVGASLIAGCAVSAAPRAATVDPTSLAAWAGDEASEPEATVLRRERFETTRVSTPPASLPFTARGPRIDVRFERAPLSSALTLLADAAQLGIVLGEGLDAEVSVDLRHVRPLEAMVALALAHDIDIAIVGRTLIARRVVAQRRNGT